jgi:WhiB family transcriptional regulator, redox-sensing transcriptional regulator
MSELDWHDQALCKNYEPSVFFGDDGIAMTYEDAEWAKAICRRCPVRDDCLDYALRNRIDYGVWGAMTEAERRRERTNRRRATSVRTDARRAEASRMAAIGATVEQIARGLGVSHRTAQRLVYSPVREAMAS